MMYVSVFSVFEKCREVVKPDKYYAACVFDSCTLPDLDLECSSLQIYAAICADQNVCVDWRSHTNGVCCKYLAIYHELLGSLKLNLYFSYLSLNHRKLVLAAALSC